MVLCPQKSVGPTRQTAATTGNADRSRQKGCTRAYTAPQLSDNAKRLGRTRSNRIGALESGPGVECALLVAPRHGKVHRHVRH